MTTQQTSIFDLVTEPTVFNTPVVTEHAVPVSFDKSENNEAKTDSIVNVYETDTCTLTETLSGGDIVVKTVYKGASASLPAHHLVMNNEYDGKEDTLTIDWSKDDIDKLWMGIIEEYFSLLNYAKTNSKDRQDILRWMSTESFDIICEHLGLNTNALRIGVFNALDNKDIERNLDAINSGIVSFEPGVKSIIADFCITTKELSSRFNINKIANAFISKITKCKQSKKKQRLIDDINSPEFKEYCEGIGLNASAVINKVNTALGKIDTGETKELNEDFSFNRFQRYELGDLI
ncbi:hypothetical protein [Photobacterium damselae]|uniref:hypothetical protein n=1 Tax=Photobacterium damselae TaxID=38293 RepID=UPI000D65FF50|nr:hypothetical protein [Photobacterium damselae]AWK84534.1 hypothetical protein BST98_21100 [Photobacterium damselae]MBE8127807.1 hypothetical protein [Photobacterium damselae subsp. piscicida]TLS87040.1 hypothetical protein FD720_09255 [Photobacterium damselae subsp. damselae]WIH21826.1 hypothetical protein KQY33_20545 [Photobacterium damselae]